MCFFASCCVSESCTYNTGGCALENGDFCGLEGITSCCKIRIALPEEFTDKNGQLASI